MKKIFYLLLLTAITLQAQTTGVNKLKIAANPEKTTATRVVVQDATTGEVGYVAKSTLQTDISGKENTIAPGTTSQYFRGDKTWQTLDKTAVGLGNVDNTSDLNKPISTATQTALNAKQNTSEKNQVNGYAGLGSDGKLISAQLPSITITDTFVVGSQSAMLALTAETGDVAVRTDLSKSYILKGTNPSVLVDWQELLSPVDGVTSVFGRVGSVTAQTGDYTTAQVTETTNKKYQTDAQALYNDATSSIQTQLNSKANDNAVVHLAGTETIAGAKTFSSTPSFDNNIYLKKLGSWANPANYSVIGGMTNGFVLSSGTNKHAYLDLLPLTQPQQFTFPDKSGTFAMTSDVPTISGTTNYVTKFATASTLGNSQIFDNGTNVGIGTIAPDSKLQVIGTGKFTGSGFGSNGLEAYGANGGNGIYSVAGGSAGSAVYGFTSDASSFGGTFVNNGPGVALRVQGSGYFPSKLITLSGAEPARYSSNIGLNIVSGSTLAMSFGTRSNNIDYDNTLNIINGNVGIGTTNPTSPLQIAGGGYPAIQMQGGTTGGGGIRFLAGTENYGEIFGEYESTNNSILFFRTRNSGTVAERLRIGPTGVATFTNTVTATGFFQSSDLRLKDIISRDGDVIKYKWKDKRDDKIHIGYVAQEVQKENPDQVNADEKGILSVNYIEILVEKIRKLEKEIELLKAK